MVLCMMLVWKLNSFISSYSSQQKVQSNFVISTVWSLLDIRVLEKSRVKYLKIKGLGLANHFDISNVFEISVFETLEFNCIGKCHCQTLIDQNWLVYFWGEWTEILYQHEFIITVFNLILFYCTTTFICLDLYINFFFKTWTNG